MGTTDLSVGTRTPIRLFEKLHVWIDASCNELSLWYMWKVTHEMGSSCPLNSWTAGWKICSLISCLSTPLYHPYNSYLWGITGSYSSDLVLKYLIQGSRMSPCECVPSTTVNISLLKKNETKALKITCFAMHSQLHPPLCAEQLTIASQ